MARVLEAKGNPAIVEMKENSKAEGRAEALLTMLESRGFTPSESDRARILATTERETLERWIRLAVTASSLDEVLGSP